jgi:hypothetical protein
LPAIRFEDLTHAHRLRFQLPPGWVPQDPWDDRWRYGATEVTFIDDDRLLLRLADSTPVVLPLPLPEVMTLPTPDTVLPSLR